MIKRLSHILFLLVAVAALSSCNHKDLCYEHIHTSKLRVVYDWSDAPEANPRGMCVFFYSLDEPGTWYRFDFANTHGGEIELPQGHYRLITYNNDTEAVRFSATNDFGLHKAYTREGDLLEPMYGNGVTSSAQTDNGERVVITPDGLWGCHATDIEVADHSVSYIHESWFSRAEEVNSDDQTILLYPHDMLCHYDYEVRNVENAEHINRISAAISGMAGAMSVSDESLPSETVTLPLSASAHSDSKKITGKFLTFGNNSASAVPHKMTFYVVMDDGSKYVVKDAANLDVSSQVDGAPDPRHVHIVIDNLKLPGPVPSDDGFIPTIDDWGEQHEELQI